MRRRSVHHHVRTQCGAPDLRGTWQTATNCLCHGFAQTSDAVGRASFWARIRSRHFHDRRRVRLQHGGHGKKGLNIFNDKYVLASPDTATDADFAHIEAVIAHEYFHNWTGNRITCRDWFQLCLKEGLTVLRDQEFS